jgi:hypothetical protein
MKIMKYIVCLATLLSGVCLATAANLATTNSEADLPDIIMSYRVSPDVRQEANKFATAELRVAYLSSVIASNAVYTNEAQNFRKSSAIRLVGVIESTNSIPILVSNIVFVDAKYPQRPAYQALETFGEPAVPYLLDALKDPSASTEKVDLVIEVLRFIKKAKYNPDQWDKFVDVQKKTLPPELQRRLNRKVWVDD